MKRLITLAVISASLLSSTMPVKAVDPLLAFSVGMSAFSMTMCAYLAIVPQLEAYYAKKMLRETNAILIHANAALEQRSQAIDQIMISNDRKITSINYHKDTRTLNTVWGTVCGLAIAYATATLWQKI